MPQGRQHGTSTVVNLAAGHSSVARSHRLGGQLPSFPPVGRAVATLIRPEVMLAAGS